MNETQLKQEPRPAQQATTSLICGILSWPFLGILIFLMNRTDILAVSVPLLICLILIVALPYTAILRGVRAIQRSDKLTPGKKIQAWAGVILGALIYVVVLGYWLLALTVT